MAMRLKYTLKPTDCIRYYNFTVLIRFETDAIFFTCNGPMLLIFSESFYSMFPVSNDVPTINCIQISHVLYKECVRELLIAHTHCICAHPTILLISWFQWHNDDVITNALYVTCPLCGTYTIHRGLIPSQNGLLGWHWLFFYVVPNKLLNKQSNDKWLVNCRFLWL